MKNTTNVYLFGNKYKRRTNCSLLLAIIDLIFSNPMKVLYGEIKSKPCATCFCAVNKQFLLWMVLQLSGLSTFFPQRATVLQLISLMHSNVCFNAQRSKLLTVTLETLPVLFAAIRTVTSHIVTHIISSTLTTRDVTINAVVIWGTD